MWGELERAQSLLNETDIRIGAVDCQEFRNENFCRKQKLRAWPTTRIYNNRTLHEYEEATGTKSAKQYALLPSNLSFIRD